MNCIYKKWLLYLSIGLAFFILIIGSKWVFNNSEFLKLNANQTVDLFLYFEGKTLAKKYDLRHSYDQAEMFGGDVEVLGIVFDTRKAMTKDQARRLLYEMQLGLISAINNNKRLQPLLKVIPFTPFNTEITIHYSDDQGRERLAPSFCIASVTKGKFRYYYDNTYQECGFSKVEYETYEEAEKLLKANSEGNT